MRMVVVGGVATGMSAAARARRLDEDAEIIVFEKGPHVSCADCGLPYYVGGEIEDRGALTVQTPRSLKAALNLDVRVNHEVVDVDPEARTVTVKSRAGETVEPYDALVLAPGADAAKPPIPGIDSARVQNLKDVGDAIRMRELVEEGAEDAVVIGAGFIGLEIAEALKAQGLTVTIVELAPHVLPNAEPEIAARITTEARRLGIRVETRTSVTGIVPGEYKDTVRLSNGKALPADIIVTSIGVRPATDLFEKVGVKTEKGAIVVDEHGRTNLPDVWAGGDATMTTDPITGARRIVPLAGPANRSGRLIADDIMRGEDDVEPRRISQPLGTAILRMGDLTMALTGATRESLDAAGIGYHTINLHPFQHAGYFPGAEQVHMVVHFAEDDGRVLGAQAVGADGVDKRIDVLATAIRGGLRVDDLIDVDLSYSPPYGSAKDPINIVGMFGENVLTGVTDPWYAEDLAEAMEEALILDCRTESEFAGGHLPDALNVPHTEVRERLDEIREAADGRPIRVHCQSGFRSYLAERILKQNGFDVKNLSGGMLTLVAAMNGGLAPSVELETGN